MCVQYCRYINGSTRYRLEAYFSSTNYHAISSKYANIVLTLPARHLSIGIAISCHNKRVGNAWITR